MSKLKNKLAHRTVRVRHLFIKLISPKVYEATRTYNMLPRGVVKALKRKFSNRSLLGVEIGVFHGKHAESILKNLNIKKLYLIDPYKAFLDRSREEMKEIFYKATSKLNPYSDKIVWITTTSQKAVKFVPSELDFVYIDGNHDFECVQKDIELYYPKVKVGGIIGGHDFSMNFKGVVKAVIEFTSKNSLNLYGDSPCDWWIVKEK